MAPAPTPAPTVVLRMAPGPRRTPTTVVRCTALARAPATTVVRRAAKPRVPATTVVRLAANLMRCTASADQALRTPCVIGDGIAAPQSVATSVHRPTNSTTAVIIGLTMDRLLGWLGRLLRLRLGLLRDGVILPPLPCRSVQEFSQIDRGLVEIRG